MAVQVTYKGSQITSFTNTSKTLKTQGKYLEGDVLLAESITLQNKTVTPTESSQSITASSSYEGLGTVTVEAIPSAYIVPTGNISINSNGEFNVTAYSMATVSVNTVNNQNKSVTPTEALQEVSADSGYTGLGIVSVAGISSTYVGTGVARISSSDLVVSGSTITAPSGYYSQNASANVGAGSAFTPATTITTNPSITVDANGLVTATVSNYRNITPTVNEGYIVSGTSGKVQASGSSTYQLSTQGASTITPTETQQTAVASGKYTTGNVVVAGISSDYVGSAIPTRSQADLGTNGAMVTIPSGYYSENVEKEVASGSATTPATTITVTPAITVNASGLITATANGSSNITPTVNAGYVTAGTAGRVSISGSNTSQLTTRGASTYTPATTAQTIPSGIYLTGVQTISAIPSQYIVPSGTLSISANASGINVSQYASVDVNVPIPSFVTYYTGTSAPSNSLGSNGDIYLQTTE